MMQLTVWQKILTQGFSWILEILEILLTYCYGKSEYKKHLKDFHF